MNIEEGSKEKYLKIVKHDYIFDAVAFNELNKYKVEELKYLLFKEKKYRFGLCVGVRDGEVLCPFSAPFGTMVAIRKPVSIKYYDEAIDALDAFVVENNYRSIRFILPPMFYDETGISILVNALYRNGYGFKNIDLNFQFDLKKICTEMYPEMIPHNGRKNLRISLNSDLVLKHCNTYEEEKKAYNVIAENRESKGYPLRMTFQQVIDTVQIVDHDFFLVMKDDDAIAATLIYYINEDVAQVIYWGDRPSFGEFKPINYLAYQLIHYYGERGLSYLDIGPSTENSIPNYGLCDFKESIGCDISSKITMVKNVL
ncbi:MAG TPA: hypothetical protein VFC84_17015 [Desulfosporosinus sp.]|nr:hypothetical protein [Desulfosporosinus sp.]